MSNINQNSLGSPSNQSRLRCPSHRQFGMLRAAMVLGLLALACRADVIYTNLGNTNALPGSIQITGGTSGVSAAQSFIPQQDYILSSLTIALSNANVSGSFTVALMASDPGGAPGTILEQFNVTSVPAASGTSVVPIVLNSVNLPALTARATYWVAVAGATNGAFGNWQSNTIGDIASSSADSQVDVSSSGLVGPWTAGTTRNGLARGAFQVTGNPDPNSTTPTISSLSPSSISAGSPAFNLTVNGTHFVTGAIVKFSNAPLTTTFVSDVQLTASVPADLVKFPSTSGVTVANPSGPASNNFYFSITAGSGVSISALSPSSATVGGPDFNLTITGTNFAPEASVNFGGTTLNPPTAPTSTQIVVTVPAALIASAGVPNVSVVQTSGTSNTLPFTISTASTLAISGLSPSSAVAGGDNFTLTLNGSNFTSDAVVHFGTSSLAPSAVTPTQIQVTVPSTLIAAPGTPSVSVVEASGTSNAVTFPITASSTVEITSVDPGFTLAGGANFSLLIKGTNFAPDATVHFGAAVLAPFSVTTNQILVNVPSTLITNVSVPSITVVQSAGTSNTLTMTVGLLPGQLLTVASGGVLQPGKVGAAYAATLVATGGAPPYSWTLANSALPPGLSLSTAGVISGIPTTSGAVQFSTKAIDSSSATVNASFLLTITNPGATITTPAALPAGMAGAAYSQALSATGGAPPYVWSLTAGALPAGLSLSSAGLISGTPTASGPFSFSVQVADKFVTGAPQPFSLTINPASFGAARSGILSQVASGGGWKSSIYLVNASSSAVTVVINFWADTGSALSLPLAVTQVGGVQNLTAATVTETIAPNSTFLVESDSQASVSATGWAEVLSTGPVTGFGVLHYASPGGAVSETTVPLESTFTPSFILPYDGLNGFKAGVALANLVAAQPAVITVTIWSEDGRQIGTPDSINLPAGGHTSFLLADRLPATTSNRGFIEFNADSTTNITGFGLRINPAGGLTLIPKLQRP